MKNFSEKKRIGSLSRSLTYTALSVALITVCAWISVPIAAIPVTLQTFAVCLLGALLGWKRGLAAVAVYILMGLVGIPVFTGFKAGPAALFGVTGGYLFGFAFAVLIPAFAKKLPVRNVWGRSALFYAAMILGMAVCYAFGTAWFVLMYKCSWGYALMLCVVPYLLPDAVKLAVAALLAARLERFVR